MGLSKKVASVFKARAEKMLDRLEDPLETLEYSYAQQLEMLTKARRGVSNVAASRLRVETRLRARRLEAALDGQSGGAGPDNDLSRLTAEHASLRAQEDRLAAARDQLEMKVENFRLRMEAIKAEHAAGESRSRAAEIWSSVSGKMADSAIATTPYLEQREMLTRLWYGSKGLQASREEMERQLNALRSRRTELADQARQAREASQLDLAQALSSEEATIGTFLSELEENHRSLQAYEGELAVGYEQLAAEVEKFRAAKEALRGPGSPDEASTDDVEEGHAD
jgi:phage shock protein A